MRRVMTPCPRRPRRETDSKTKTRYTNAEPTGANNLYLVRPTIVTSDRARIAANI